jgi:carboxyl-terminal processing protease
MIDRMTGTIRALLAALVVIGVALAGALYLRARSPHPVLAQRAVSLNSVPYALDVGNDAGDQNIAPADLLDRALTRLDTEFYLPFAPQTPFRGEEKALTAYLQLKHVAHPSLPPEYATGDPDQDSQRLADVVTYAEREYGAQLGPSAPTDLTETALSGVMDSVGDPYTVYLTPKEIQSLNETLQGGDFGGIGVYILQLKDGEVVLDPIEGAPAAQAGMKPGTIVDTVDGRKVRGVPIDLVERWIRGDAGSHVVLATHIYKTTKQFRYDIVRAIIHVPTVTKKIEDGYDYIRLSDFGQTSADEIRDALIYGKQHNAKGYILDLRYNGGGLVDAAIKISSYFIPQGTIVSTIDRQGHRQVQEALGDALGGLQPLVILVNKYTASASEITTGALQDYHLAAVVGTKTFGKGVIQSIYDMPDGGALKITTARYVTPLGREIQHKGITPDIVVPQSDDVILDTPADKQLAAAKAELKTLLK